MDDFHNNKELITFRHWKQKLNYRVTKFAKSLTTTSNSWKKHIYVKRQQHACYTKLKEELGENEVLLNVDYSENYSNIQQGEIQSAYFGHDSFSIFTDKDDDLINENITIISEASDHSHIAAFTCINKVFGFVLEKHNLPPEVTLHIWIDGCAGQFRSQYVFALVSEIDS